LSYLNLQDNLHLKGFSQLTHLDLYGNQLTSLDLSDLPKEKLLVLNVRNNKIIDSSFLQGLVNLKELDLRNNESLTGSLAMFAKMKRLR